MGAVACAAAVVRPALRRLTGSAGLSPEEGVTAGEQPPSFGNVAGWADGRPEGAKIHLTASRRSANRDRRNDKAIRRISLKALKWNVTSRGLDPKRVTAKDQLA
jgi:hypothetical protein